MVGHFHLASMIHSFQGSWHPKTSVQHTWVTDIAHRDFLHKASITATCAQMQNASRKDSLEPLQQTIPSHFGSFSHNSNSCRLHYVIRPACSYIYSRGVLHIQEVIIHCPPVLLPNTTREHFNCISHGRTFQTIFCRHF